MCVCVCYILFAGYTCVWLTRDGTGEPVSRDQILRRERGQENINFPCLADHVQDWQPYPVDPYSCYMCDHTCLEKMYLVYVIVVTWNQTLYYLLLQMVIPLLLCCRNKKRSPRKDVRNTEPPAKRVCLPRSVDALARLPKHNNRPRCLRVVNSRIHAPHPLDLREAINFPKPPILLNFEHLKHLGPSVLSLS